MSVIDLVIFAFALAAGAWTFVVVQRSADLAPLAQPLIALLAGAVAALTVIAFAALWLEQTGDPWNNARLAPAIALHYGYQLYYPLHEGPVLSTVVGPVAFLAYWPVGFLHGSPTALILVGSALNLAVCAALLAALVRRLAHDQTVRGFSALVAAQLILAFPALRYSVFCIHADAPALFLTALGAGLVIFARDGLGWSRALLAALALALAVWAKQSLAPVFLVVALVAMLHHGGRATGRFIVASAAVGALVSALFVGWLGYTNLRDNMFAVPARHPWHQMSLATGEIYPGLSATGRAAHLKVLLASALEIVRSAWPLFAVLLVALVDNLLTSRPGRRWPRRAWAAWFLVAVGLLPTAAVGRIKIGGEVNHESFAIFFLVAAVVSWLASLAFERGRAQPARLAAVLAVLAVINAPRALEYRGWRAAWDNQSEIAYRYDVRHRGEIYFPWNPLTSLLAEGKLYHFDYGVFDRNLGGATVSAEHLAQHLPSPRPVIASFLAHHDAILRTYFSNYESKPAVAELPGWKIYGPPGAPSSSR